VTKRRHELVVAPQFAQEFLVLEEEGEPLVLEVPGRGWKGEVEGLG
jgi:hypothetical protein